MTWHGTALVMMRYKRAAASGILCLERTSLASNNALLNQAAQRKFGFGVLSGPGRSAALNDDKEKGEILCIGRKLTNFSRSFWSCRGGEMDPRDKSLAKKDSVLSDDAKRESSSSSDTTNIDTNMSTTRTTTPVGSHTYQVSVGVEQGFRSYMEDEHYVSNDGDFAAVFDGHGGGKVSRYLRKNLYANVQAFLPLVLVEKQEDLSVDGNTGGTEEKLKSTRPRNPTVNDYANALESALEKVDSEILKISHWSFQGSTALVVWLHEKQEERNTGDDNMSPDTQRTILAANIGDSRAVLCRDNKAWDLSRDHKPNDPTEKSRIESLGGSVIWCGETDQFGAPIEHQGIYRVNGNLALSRAIGDRSERPHVTAEPEIISVPIEEGDEFIVVASDGLWDVMNSGDAVNYVKLSLKAGISKKKIASMMVEEAMRLGTWDNVTVVIIWIDRKL